MSLEIELQMITAHVTWSVMWSGSMGNVSSLLDVMKNSYGISSSLSPFLHLSFFIYFVIA